MSGKRRPGGARPRRVLTAPAAGGGTTMVMGTDIDIEVGALIDRVASWDVPGEHLWILTGAWKVDPTETGQVNLDTENMLQIAGPGCYKCEEPYTPALAAQRCTGSVELMPRG